MVCFISFNRSVSSSWSSIQFWRKHIETRGMSQINMQKTYQLLIVVMLIGLSMARPNGNIESQVKNRLIAFHFTLISNMVIKWIKTIFSRIFYCWISPWRRKHRTVSWGSRIWRKVSHTIGQCRIYNTTLTMSQTH